MGRIDTENRLVIETRAVDYPHPDQRQFQLNERGKVVSGVGGINAWGRGIGEQTMHLDDLDLL